MTFVVYGHRYPIIKSKLQEVINVEKLGRFSRQLPTYLFKKTLKFKTLQI